MEKTVNLSIDGCGNVTIYEGTCALVWAIRCCVDSVDLDHVKGYLSLIPRSERYIDDFEYLGVEFKKMGLKRDDFLEQYLYFLDGSDCATDDEEGICTRKALDKAYDVFKELATAGFFSVSDCTRSNIPEYTEYLEIMATRLEDVDEDDEVYGDNVEFRLKRAMHEMRKLAALVKINGNCGYGGITNSIALCIERYRKIIRGVASEYMEQRKRIGIAIGDTDGVVVDLANELLGIDACELEINGVRVIEGETLVNGQLAGDVTIIDNRGGKIDMRNIRVTEGVYFEKNTGGEGTPVERKIIVGDGVSSKAEVPGKRRPGRHGWDPEDEIQK